MALSRRGTERRARRRELNPSGASEADGDFAPLDDDRHLPAAGEADHPVELILVRFDVHVGEGNVSFRVVLTGRGRMGSSVFSEDLDAVGVHRGPPVFDHNPHNSRTTPAVLASLAGSFPAASVSPSRRATGVRQTSSAMPPASPSSVFLVPTKNLSRDQGVPTRHSIWARQTPRRSTT